MEKRAGKMKVAVIGSRNAEKMSVDGVISHIPLSCTQIISGGAEGVDALAKEAAEKLGIGYICYLPDYDRYGADRRRLNETISHRGSRFGSCFLGFSVARHFLCDC